MKYYRRRLTHSTLTYKKALLKGIKERGCLCCPEKDACCLEFHHVNGEDKKGTISRMARDKTPLQTFLDELNKCVLLCSNCHKKVHANRLELPHSVSKAFISSSGPMMGDAPTCIGKSRKLDAQLRPRINEMESVAIFSPI